MTQITEADREALRQWARMHGHDDAQAEAIATDPEAHRVALAQWFTTRGLNPAQATDPATPNDPAILAEWGLTQGVQPNTAEVWASTREDFPTPCLIGAPALGGPVGRRPGVYSLAELEAWEGPQHATRRNMRTPSIDPTQFARQERVTVVEFCTRTGKDRSTLSKALNNPAYQGPDAKFRAPARGTDRKFNARELTAFCNALPRRRGRPPKKNGS